MNKPVDQTAKAALLGEIQDWFKTPLGHELLVAEQQAVDRLISSLFGYHLLQVGVLPHGLYHQAPASHKFMMLPAASVGEYSDSDYLIGDPADMPMSSDCVDAVILHHALDFTDTPHQVLRETARVLRPGGKLIIVGFNPVSLWGLWKLGNWTRNARSGTQAVPWRGYFIRQRRLIDWLVLLALKQEQVETGFFSPPLQSAKWRQRVQGLEQLGGKYLSGQGGFYAFLASKETLAMTPVHMSWQRRLAFPLTRPAQQVGRTAAAKVHVMPVRRPGDKAE